MTRGRRLRVCLITQWFSPEPAFVAVGIAHALQDLGCEVEVLTAHPNYPAGSVYPGYGRAWRTRSETVDGISVFRAPVYPSHDQSAARRMLNYLSWAFAATVLGAQRVRRCDVTLVYGSPATAALPAVMARGLFGIPGVFMAQDLWPDSVISSGMLNTRPARLTERVLHATMGALYKRMDHVVAISPGMLDVLRSRGVSAERSSVVYNWGAEDKASFLTAVEPLRTLVGVDEAALVLMYAGNHGPAQALETLIDAVRVLPRSLACHLALVGDGISKAELQARAAGDDRIHFLDSVPQEILSTLMRGADIQCVSLADLPVFEITVPSKMQNILAAGQPMLVIARGDAARIVADAGAGRAAAPGDVDAVAAAIVELSRERDELPAMGARGRSFYKAEMSRDIGGRRLFSILDCAARTRRTGGR